MPYLKLNTNQTLDQESELSIARDLSALVAELLNKPESYVMTEIQSGMTMTFAGSDAPLAYLELKSIGLPDNATSSLSKALCEFVTDKIAIDSNRIYIEFSNAQRSHWGWDQRTF